MGWIVLCLVIPVSGFSAERVQKVGEREAIPDRGFTDLAALEHWSGSSSFGGGFLQKLTLGDTQTIYWTTRTVTSGRPSAELVFWTQMHGRFIPCLILPVRLGAYTATVVDHQVIITRQQFSGAEVVEVMRLSAEFFMADLL